MYVKIVEGYFLTQKRGKNAQYSKILKRVIFAPNKLNRTVARFPHILLKRCLFFSRKNSLFRPKGVKQVLTIKTKCYVKVNTVPLQYRKFVTKMPYLCDNSCSNSRTTVA